MYIHPMVDPFSPAEAIYPDGSVVSNVHSERRCAGRGCTIHHPSDHHMAQWPMNWRDDRGFFERLCPHGVGHPDPDDAIYHASVGNEIGVHHCDGCCAGE